MQHNAITIANPLPATLVALSGETLDLIASLEARATAIAAVTTVDEMRTADALVSEVIKLNKAIEAERKRLKAPITELAAALDEASSEARTPLIHIKANVGRLILAFQAAENRRREEERQRLEAERRQQEAARAAALEAQRQAEAAARAAAPDDEPAPWDDAPAAVPVIVPEVLPPSIQAQMDMAPLKSTSVVRKTVKRVVVVDASQVPREVAGVPLWTLDLKAIEKLAKSGVRIPGVELQETETLAAKG